MIKSCILSVSAALVLTACAVPQPSTPARDLPPSLDTYIHNAAIAQSLAMQCGRASGQSYAYTGPDPDTAATEVVQQLLALGWKASEVKAALNNTDSRAKAEAYLVSKGVSPRTAKPARFCNLADQEVASGSPIGRMLQKAL